jgi:hypothetical protein
MTELDEDYRVSSLVQAYELLKRQNEDLQKEIGRLREIIVWYFSVRKLRKPVHKETCECVYCASFRQVSWIVSRA